MDRYSSWKLAVSGWVDRWVTDWLDEYLIGEWGGVVAVADPELAWWARGSYNSGLPCHRKLSVIRSLLYTHTLKAWQFVWKARVGWKETWLCRMEGMGLLDVLCLCFGYARPWQGELSWQGGGRGKEYPWEPLSAMCIYADSIYTVIWWQHSYSRCAVHSWVGVSGVHPQNPWFNLCKPQNWWALGDNWSLWIVKQPWSFGMWGTCRLPLCRTDMKLLSCFWHPNTRGREHAPSTPIVGLELRLL